MTACGLGTKVFLNCAGFIKIDTAAISDTTTNYIEVLDGSRVHPETYEWAKKMAVDALEYDEVFIWTKKCHNQYGFNLSSIVASYCVHLYIQFIGVNSCFLTIWFIPVLFSCLL